jgi:hypothetical protein
MATELTSGVMEDNPVEGQEIGMVRSNSPSRASNAVIYDATARPRVTFNTSLEGELK